MNALQRFKATENIVNILRNSIEGTWELTPDRLRGKTDFIAVTLKYTHGEIKRDFTLMVGEIHAPHNGTTEYADLLCEFGYGVDACAVFELTDDGNVIRHSLFETTLGDIQHYITNDYNYALV